MKQNIEIQYLQISSGRGPAECCWVVAQVLKVLLQEFKANGFEYEVISRNKGMEQGTLNSCSIRVEGHGVKKVLAGWEGSIQWIGKSPFRKFHKRKNWFVGIGLFNETKGTCFNQNELSFQTFRSSGIVVTAADSKSQMQNKKSAIEKMKIALKQNEIEKLQKRMDDQWREHLDLVRGDAIKVFEGAKFKERK